MEIILNTVYRILDAIKKCLKAGTIVRIVPLIVPGLNYAFEVLMMIGKWVLPILNTVQKILDTFNKFPKAGTIVRIVQMIIRGLYYTFKFVIMIGI